MATSSLDDRARPAARCGRSTTKTTASAQARVQTIRPVFHSPRWPSSRKA